MSQFKKIIKKNSNSLEKKRYNMELGRKEPSSYLKERCIVQTFTRNKFLKKSYISNG